MKKTKNRLITGKFKDVLLHIAKKGAKTKYEIEKELRKVSHASIHEAIKFFEQNGIVKGEQIGFTRIGIPKTKYHLTLFGVCIALKHADVKDYGKIIQTWKHLSPFLFGKYDFLVKKVGMEEAQMFYFRYMRDIKTPDSAEEIFYRLVLETLIWYQEDFIDEELTEESKLKFEKWIKIFKKEPDFRNIIIEYIEDSMDYLLKEAKWFAFLKSTITKKEEPKRKPQLKSEEEIRKEAEERVKFRLEDVWDEIPDKEKAELIKSEKEWLKRMQEESLKEWQQEQEED